MNQNGRAAVADFAGDEVQETREQEAPEKNRPPDDQQKENQRKKGPQKPPVFKRPAFRITVLIVALTVIILAGLYWLHARHFVSTDDAYVDGNIVQIAPQVAALVQTRHINDNQLVQPGDLMIELDPTDYNVALQQAQAQLKASQGRLAQAQAQIEASRAAVVQSQAQVDSAQVEFDNATRDLERYLAVDPRARSRQQLDNATTTQRTAQAQLEQAKAAKASADANVATSEAAIKAAAGDVLTAEASVKRAQVNLGYCRIYAPCQGRVTERTVEAGNYVQPGQTMFMLVQPDVWVTANFKETQLTHMRPGQEVTLSVDAFPKKKFTGHVDSIQAGSGARFGVLPAENATGNFVKIVQRVPVKIVFEHGPNTNNAEQLSPGLSVLPKVRVR